MVTAASSQQENGPSGKAGHGSAQGKMLRFGPEKGEKDFVALRLSRAQLTTEGRLACWVDFLREHSPGMGVREARELADSGVYERNPDLLDLAIVTAYRNEPNNSPLKDRIRSDIMERMLDRVCRIKSVARYVEGFPEEVPGALADAVVIALESWDPERERASSFDSLVILKFKFCMRERLRDLDPLNRYQRDLVKRLEQEELGALELEARRPLSESREDLSSEDKKLALLLRALSSPVSLLDFRWGQDLADWEGQAESLTLENPQNPYASVLLGVDLARAFGRLADLASKDKDFERSFRIMCKHLLDGKTQKEIAEEEGVTESRVCQIEGECRFRMRRLLGIDYLGQQSGP